MVNKINLVSDYETELTEWENKIYNQGQKDILDKVINMFYDRMKELSDINFKKLDLTEYNKVASVFSECNKWLDTLESLKEEI